MPFNSNNSDLKLSKLVTRFWCWVWFSFKPLPQSEGSTAQRLTLLLQVFELEKKGNWSFDWKQMSGEMGLARNRLQPESLSENYVHTKHTKMNK